MYPTGMRMDVEYTALRNAYRLAVQPCHSIVKINSSGLASCMQPPRDGKEESKHHDFRDTSNLHLHQFPGSRIWRHPSGLDSNTANCACVIHATLFVVVLKIVQLVSPCTRTERGKCQA